MLSNLEIQKDIYLEDGIYRYNCKKCPQIIKDEKRKNVIMLASIHSAFHDANITSGTRFWKQKRKKEELKK
jgi:hypothetical protein